MQHYAIMITGSGRGKRYSIQRITGNGTQPVNGKRYTSIEQAQQAAAALNIHIEKIGDFYQII